MDMDYSVTHEQVVQGKEPFMTFRVAGEVIGRLWYREGQFSFDGDADESADIFFEAVVRQLNRLEVQE